MPSARKLPHVVKPGGLSAADRERIAELAETGLKCWTIARRIEKHPATVRWFMYRDGLTAPSTRHAASPDTPDRRGRKGFSTAEDIFIEVLRADGVGLTEIAARATKAFGHPRSRDGIRSRLIMLAAREDDAREAA